MRMGRTARPRVGLALGAVLATGGAGCSWGKPVYKGEVLAPQTQQHGLVVFYRVREATADGVPFVLWDYGGIELLTRIEGGACRVVLHSIPPGLRQYSVTDLGHAEPHQHHKVPIEVEAGETYFVRVSPGRSLLGGGFEGYEGEAFAQAHEVDAEVAMEEMQTRRCLLPPEEWKRVGPGR